VLVLGSASLGGAQAKAAQTPTEKQLSEAKSIPLPARTVSSSVGVSATLLTWDSVRRLFGKEIANTYAVVQLTVSNRNPDAAFVLHAAYLDVGHWALGGAGLTGVSASTKDYQAATTPNTIASVEARIARGQLLDAQTWSARNWTVRLLTVAGSVASAVVFNAAENAAKYVAAFNGTVVPGVAIAWPDGSVGQLNRISDFGFQTNKVFAKESADIVVCFFPMDLFLAPGLRDVFVHSPALFLSPYQVLFTKENAKAREAFGLPADVNNRLNALARLALTCFPGPPPKEGQKPTPQEIVDQALKACEEYKPNALVGDSAAVTKAEWQSTIQLLEYMSRFGANNIPVIVDGVMTVDVDTVPASIDDITFDDNDKATTAAYWASGEHKAALICRFCANGQVSIQEASALGIDSVKVIGDESNDKKLAFSFKTTKPVDSDTVLHIIVSKPSGDAKKTEPIKSMPFVYTVKYTFVTPTVASVSIANKMVTLKGANVSNLKSHPAALSLTREGGTESDNKPIDWPADATADTLTFSVPTDLSRGCWDVKLKFNSVPVDVPHGNGQVVSSDGKPTLKSATLDNNRISLKGSDLVDTSACGGAPVKLKVVGPNVAPADVKATTTSATEVTFDKPNGLTDPKGWSVRIGDDDATRVDIAAAKK
jgi:hypothetical protein